MSQDHGVWLDGKVLYKSVCSIRPKWIVVAVGTTTADRPPHRSVWARLRIRLLPRMRGGKGCLPHTMQSLGHAFPALCRVHVRLNGVLLSLRPSLPGLRRRPSFVVRLVHRYYGTVRTSPARSCPPFGLWPSRTGLDP